MAEAQWEDLTPAEKIEDLRRDVKRIFDELNRISADLSRRTTRDDLARLERRLSLAGEVAAPTDRHPPTAAKTD